MNIQQAQQTLANVSFPGFTFHLHGDFTPPSATYLQATWSSPCNWQANTESKQQAGRQWTLSPSMTPSELVQTALLCVLTALEHEAREQFTYKGQAVYMPHHSADALVDLCLDNSKHAGNAKHWHWVEITVRAKLGTYETSALLKKRASCTSGPQQAAEALGRKVFGKRFLGVVLFRPATVQEGVTHFHLRYIDAETK